MQANTLVVLGTGGTIAGTAQNAYDNIGYSAAQLAIEVLMESVVAVVGQEMPLHTEQIAQIDSKDMDFAVWRSLALRCQAHLNDPSVRAIVITHGTDTLEETAWFLHCVLNAHKPVVLTGAMRPATALAGDGPQNLRDALAVAAVAGISGVMVVFAAQVHSPRWLQKVHPYRLNAFSSGEAGPLGWVEDGRVRWAYQAPVFTAMPVLLGPDDLPALPEAWPWVEVVLSCAGAGGAAVDALVTAGVQGLVVAATGNGTLHYRLEAALQRAQSRGVLVCVTSRCPQGQVLPQPHWPWLASEGLGAVKARITLLLACLAA